jgi:putative component of toxin-antitoxin plasmid stabilization module
MASASLALINAEVPMATNVIFYREKDGSVPILIWLDTLSDGRVVAKCINKIERLIELGNKIRRPEADYLRDGIYELRIGFQGINYRLLYFFHEKDAVISHGAIKEAKVPTREIDLALARKKSFAENPKSHTFNYQGP